MANHRRGRGKASPRSAARPRRERHRAASGARKKATAPRPAEEPGEDPVVAAIVEALAAAETLSPHDIAVSIAAERARPGDGPDLWRRYFTVVKQRAVNLAREGRIEIVRKGRVVDPSDFKGIVRYRLARR